MKKTVADMINNMDSDDVFFKEEINRLKELTARAHDRIERSRQVLLRTYAVLHQDKPKAEIEAQLAEVLHGWKV